MTLPRLLAHVLDGIDELSQGINSGLLSVDQWQREMAHLLYVGHTAAYMEGRDTRDLSPEARRRLGELIGDQVTYLNGFADDVDTEGWREAFKARAALYAGALKHSYSVGRTFHWPLPFHPGDGSTPCLGNCLCRGWEVQIIDEEELDADAYWRTGASERHCTECPQRAAASPYRIRGGKLI